MKTLAPTLAAVALAALTAPGASAATIEDKDLKVGLVANLQARAEVSDAKGPTGDDYDIISGTDNTESDDADFYLRRFRFGLMGSYQDDWKFALLINGDNADRAGDTTAADRGLTVHQGYIARDFSTGDVTHTVKGGLDYAFFNHANASNSAALFPTQRASHRLLPVRGVGGSYRLTAPMFRWGVDVQNNINDDVNSVNREAEGLCYTTRLEVTGPGDLALRKFQETYLNQEGTGFIVGIEAGVNQRDATGAGAATDATTTKVLGGDAVFHWEGLNLLVEARRAWLTSDTAADVDRQVLLGQVGYAFPAGGVVLEPAIRYSLIDNDTNNDDEAVAFQLTGGGVQEYGNSGDQIEVGINCYFNGHGNKLQLEYLRWDAEAGDAKADVVRLQHQLNF